MNRKTVSCPALVVAAPSSGSGKTTVVAALARHFTLQGKKVRVFKTGPDFIDPNFLSFASGNQVYQLDFWMCGEEHCKKLVAEAAQEADLILIEGVMGMFDGQCSSADIAATLGVPVLAVIDAGAMAQTFGAIAYGLAHFRDDIKMHGVVANRVGSAVHAEMLKEALPHDLAFCGYLPKQMELTLPERHLGLVQAQEVEDLDNKLDLAAKLIAENSDIPLPEPTEFELTEEDSLPASLTGTTIAVAYDTAFSFIYQANMDLLYRSGAEICYFSPIRGEALPECDAIYLPGGYPELYLQELEQNSILQQQIRDHVEANKPVLAECGGMLYLNNTLAAVEGRDDAIGKEKILELMAQVDEYIPTPDRPIDQDFLMPVEDVFSISGRGTVVTGRVETGVIKVGEEVEIVSIRETQKTTVTGVEMFRKLLDQGQAGDNIGALIRGIDREGVERGQVLCKPGSITPHTTFEAEAYILTKEEGGRHTPFFTNYRPQFYFRTTDVTGVVTLPADKEMVLPGDNVKMSVELIQPIAMDQGLRFAIREGGRTVGAGVVASVKA